MRICMTRHNAAGGRQPWTSADVTTIKVSERLANGNDTQPPPMSSGAPGRGMFTGSFGISQDRIRKISPFRKLD